MLLQDLLRDYPQFLLFDGKGGTEKTTFAAPSNPDCPYCISKVETQRKSLKDAYGKFSSFKIIGIPLFPYVIKGIDTLTKFAEALFGN